MKNSHSDLDFEYRLKYFLRKAEAPKEDILYAFTTILVDMAADEPKPMEMIKSFTHGLEETYERWYNE
jgi:uncharacterized membrane protein YgaE (UPF0421/DUF939 family)